MSKLIIMCGAPGSGKSTWATHYVKTHDNVSIVSRDAIRYSLLKDGEHYFSHEDEVLNIFYSQIRNDLQQRMDVIADASHLSYKSRKALLANVGKYYTELWAVYFRTPLETCYERNDLRSGRANVPHEAIRNMYLSMTDPKYDDWDYKRIIYVKD